MTAFMESRLGQIILDSFLKQRGHPVAIAVNYLLLGGPDLIEWVNIQAAESFL